MGVADYLAREVEGVEEDEGDCGTGSKGTEVRVGEGVNVEDTRAESGESSGCGNGSCTSSSARESGQGS